MSNETNFISTTPVRFVIQRESHLYRLLESQTKQTPGAIAIAAVGCAPLTYSRLCAQIEYVVKTLSSMGVARNDRVALVLPNGPEMAVACIAVAAWATAVPFNPAYRGSEFDSYFADLNPKALIVHSEVASPAIALAQERGIPLLTLSPALAAEAGVFTLTNDDGSPQFLQATAAEDVVFEDVVLILQTSGTTSRAKFVPLTQENIYTAARNVQAALNIVSDDRYLNVMPLFHSQGIILTIASMLAGASVVCTPGFSAEHFFEWLGEFRPTWYSAAPAIHQAILAQSRNNQHTINRYPLRFIRSAASPLAPHVMAELEEVFRCPVIEGYGMTECYPITSNPLPPGRRKAGSVGVAAGTDISIVDEAGQLTSGEIGEIAVSGHQVMRGYLNDSAINQSTFTNGWLRTGDQGYMDADGYLFVTGRLKEMINRGGEKISPREIDEVLLEHAAVAEAVSFALPHVTLGEEVGAAVVLRENLSVKEEGIQEFAATRLAEFKIPRRVLIVKSIPKSATGKVQRIGLAEKLGLGHQTVSEKNSTRMAARTPVEEKLANIWAQVLGLAMVGIHDNFFDLGGHSILAAQLIAQIQHAFGRRLPLPALYQAPTVEQLAGILGEETWPESWSSLVPIQPRGSKLPFFWVHGDESSGFLPRYLGPNQPLYALNHQSLDGKPARYTRVETLAAYYLGEIRRVQLRGPYFLGGYSFGGTVAFEMAQQLKRQGEEVAFLFLLDSHFPGDVVLDSPSGSRNSLRVPDEVRRHFHNLALLGFQEKLIYVPVRVRDKINSRMVALRKSFKKVICQGYLALGRRVPLPLRDFYILGIYSQARRNYVPQPYPGPMVYIKSELRSSEHQLNWGRLSNGMEVHEVRGDHSDIIKESYAHVWAEKLKVCLHKAQETDSDYQR